MEEKIIGGQMIQIRGGQKCSLGGAKVSNEGGQKRQIKGGQKCWGQMNYYQIYISETYFPQPYIHY